MKSLVWFRCDLRLEDNPALKQAFKEADSIEAIYIYSKNQLKKHNESNVTLTILRIL